MPSERSQTNAQTPADEMDALARRWPELNDDDWAHLPVVRPDERLTSGATYFDLNDPERGPFQASDSQEATAENRFVAKDKLDPAIWNVFVSPQQSSGDQDEIVRPIDGLRRGADQVASGEQRIEDLSRRLENEYPANEHSGGGQQT
ncbi:MAG: hypothetical protein ACJ789_10040 [Thermomicrobiales bacterium]